MALSGRATAGLLRTRVAVLAGGALFIGGLLIGAHEAAIAQQGQSPTAGLASVGWALGTTGLFVCAVIAHLWSRHRARRRGVPLRGVGSDLLIVSGGGGAVTLVMGAVGVRNGDRGDGWMLVGVIGLMLVVLLWLAPLAFILLWLSFPAFLRACYAVFGWWGVAAGAPLMAGLYGGATGSAGSLHWLSVLSFWLLLGGLFGLIGLACRTGRRRWRDASGAVRWLPLVVAAALACLVFFIWPS